MEIDRASDSTHLDLDDSISQNSWLLKKRLTFQYSTISIEYVFHRMLWSPHSCHRLAIIMIAKWCPMRVARLLQNFWNRSSLDSWYFILLSRVIGPGKQIKQSRYLSKTAEMRLVRSFSSAYMRKNPNPSFRISTTVQWIRFLHVVSTDGLVPMSTHAAKSNHPTRAHIPSDKELDCVLE